MQFYRAPSPPAHAVQCSNQLKPHGRKHLLTFAEKGKLHQANQSKRGCACKSRFWCVWTSGPCCPAVSRADPALTCPASSSWSASSASSLPRKIGGNPHRIRKRTKRVQLVRVAQTEHEVGRVAPEEGKPKETVDQLCSPVG